MSKIGKISLIIIGVIIIAFGIAMYLMFLPKQEISNNPLNSNNPVNSTPASTDKAINAFVQKANLQKSQGVNIYLEQPDQNLKIFYVKFGEPQDCPSGCFFSAATGIKYGEKIGWIAVNGIDKIDAPQFIKYDFDGSDEYLYSDDFFQFLKSKDEHLYLNAFLPLLAKDQDTPKNVLLNIANSLSTSISPYLASSLLDNPVVQKDREILTIIANLPVFRGDAYQQARTRAQDLLK